MSTGRPNPPSLRTVIDTTDVEPVTDVEWEFLQAAEFSEDECNMTGYAIGALRDPKTKNSKTASILRNDKRGMRICSVSTLPDGQLVAFSYDPQTSDAVFAVEKVKYTPEQIAAAAAQARAMAEEEL